MHPFKKLQQRLSYLPPEQVAKVEAAYVFAEKAHGPQKRASGEPYVTHPLGVAMVLATMRMDYESLVAALLHDVVEDTHITKKELTDIFGPTVAKLVDGVTKLTRMAFQSHAEMQAESFRKTILAMSSDIRVILIKLADRFHNAQTLQELPSEKISRIATETLEIYAPIAQRLGMHIMTIDLENLCFQALHPWRYKTLAKTVAKLQKDRKELAAAIEQSLQESLTRSGIVQANIFSHEKHVYSVYKSMHIRKMAVEKILRKYSFRIIVDTIDACYRALGVVHGLYKPIPGKFKDYIAIPKINGYQSLHTTLFGPQGVPVEIQIRTQIMEHRANYGIAAHWLYGADETANGTAAPREQRWLNNLLDIQQNTTSSLEFIENIKNDLFPDDVYVFTPKGKIVELPRGATVIDFAYTVHTDVGNHCTAAKVNQRFVPLSTTLKPGQTVTILTDPNANPNPSWLNFAVTGKAKSGVRNFLKGQSPQKTVELGKKLFEQAIKDLGLIFEIVPDAVINTLLASAKLTSLDELYKDIGLGNRFAILVAHQVFNLLKERGLLDKTMPQINAPFLVRGTEGSTVTFAHCCCPIPGDKIVGVLPLDQGLIIHTEDCPNVAKMQEAHEQFLQVEWAKDINEHFPVLVEIEMLDQRGALALLAQTIAKESSNIDDIIITQKNLKNAIVTVMLSVHDLEHLNRIIRRITNLPIVANVHRKRKQDLVPSDQGSLQTTANQSEE